MISHIAAVSNADNPAELSRHVNPIRVAVILEAPSITGPAKNMLAFAWRAAEAQAGEVPIQVKFITYRRPHGGCEFSAASKRLGIPVSEIPERARFDLRALQHLREAIDEFKPDILQSHNTKSHLFIRLLGLDQRYPWLAFHHGHTATNLRDCVYNQVDRFTLRYAPRVVTVCDAFKRRLQQFGVSSDRIHVRHNSVSPFNSPAVCDMNAAKARLGLPDTGFILAVGRLSREKGFADLLQAIALLGCKLPLPLVIAGHGPEGPGLRHLAERLHIQDKVMFVGHQADLSPMYASATFLAVPSHSEGSPNAVLEAMAATLPVIATRVGGVPEIIQHRSTGLIVPPRRPDALAAALHELFEDDNLRHVLSRAARAYVLARHAPDAYQRALSSLYLDVLGLTRV